MLLDLWRFVAEICRCFLMFSPSARADSLKFHGKTHWWSQAKWFPQNWHGICSSKIPTVHFSTEAAWCKRNLRVENSRDRIQTCRQGLWWVLVQSHAKFKVAQSGRIFMQNSCCPCFEVQLDRKQSLTFNKRVCLKIGYIPNYSHLVGIMISKTIGFRGTRHFQTNPSMFATYVGVSQKSHLGLSPKIVLLSLNRLFESTLFQHQIWCKVATGYLLPNVCVGPLRKLERMRWSWIAVWAKLRGS